MTLWVMNRPAISPQARQKDPEHRTRRWTVGVAEKDHGVGYRGGDLILLS